MNEAAGAGDMLRTEHALARSKADVMCFAVYTIAGGSVLRRFMVQTVAVRVGIIVRTWLSLAYPAV